MKGKLKALAPSAIILGVLLLLYSCSTLPREPQETHPNRLFAQSQLELANREADQGNYSLALALAEEARRFAIQADYPPLLISIELSRGNYLFFLGERAAAGEVWENALGIALTEGEGELAALCRIYLARGKLLGAQRENAAETAKIAAREAVAEASRALGEIKRDVSAIALGWTVVGLGEKELGRWQAAEEALGKALGIHEKEGRWELAGYDWYLIASVRSVAGNFPQAISALEEALRYDRRAENPYGAGKDWQAMGDVYAKWGGKTEASTAAYRRAAEIFRALSMNADAEAAEAKIAP